MDKTWGVKGRQKYCLGTESCGPQRVQTGPGGSNAQANSVQPQEGRFHCQSSPGVSRVPGKGGGGEEGAAEEMRSSPSQATPCLVERLLCW